MLFIIPLGVQMEDWQRRWMVAQPTPPKAANLSPSPLSFCTVPFGPAWKLLAPTAIFLPRRNSSKKEQEKQRVLQHRQHLEMKQALSPAARLTPFKASPAARWEPTITPLHKPQPPHSHFSRHALFVIAKAASKQSTCWEVVK